MGYSFQQVQTDVLIIGSGAAACMAALEAGKYGLKVLMADRGRLARSGSSATAGAGTAAAFGHTTLGKKGNPDTPETHFRDTVIKGRYLSNQRLVRCLVQEIPGIVRHLTELGIPYVRTDEGLYYQNQGVGQTYPRNCTPKGNGAAVTEWLIKEAAFRRTAFLERTRIVKLFTEDGRVMGALGIDSAANKLYLIQAKSIVLCAGSATALQTFASAAYRTAGDSYWLAYDAGADLADMEFLEFTFIPLVEGKAVHCGGSTQLTSRGGRFYNVLGERFMERYNPGTLERTTRAVLVPAFYREMKEGRGPVYLDCASIAPERWKEWESIGHAFLGFLKAVGADYTRTKVQLVPALHCSLGGIVIDEWARTGVEGLYAAGEASTGVHGAVRLGGNAFAECFVFGTRAGRRASLDALARSHAAVHEDEAVGILDDLTNPHGSELPDSFSRQIGSLQYEAWRSLGVVRSGPDLQEGYNYFVREYGKQTEYVAADPASLDGKITLRNLLLTGIACTAGGLARQETRGGHCRDDFPQENDDFLVHLIFNKKGGFRCQTSPVSFGVDDVTPHSGSPEEARKTAPGK